MQQQESVSTTSLDASDVIPQHGQAPCSAVMSAAVALQEVMVEAPGEMRRDVGSDLVFPLFLGRIGGTTPTVWTFCP